MLQPYADEFKEWYENESSDIFAKKDRDYLEMNSICLFDLQQVYSDVFLTYLLSIEKSNNAYFSFSCYDGKWSAFIHLTAQSGQIQNESDEIAMSKIMKSLRKTIAKTMSENGESVIEGKEHMSFKCYQQTCKHLIKDGSPGSAFALCFHYCNGISFLDQKQWKTYAKWDYDNLKIYFPGHKSD